MTTPQPHPLDAMLEAELTPKEHASLVAEADTVLSRFTELSKLRDMAANQFAALNRRLTTARN